MNQTNRKNGQTTMNQYALILLEPNKKFQGFELSIGDLIMLFDRYYTDRSFRKSHRLNEAELKELVQKILIDMRENYLQDS